MDYPDGFLWGAATAAHQVEGGNWNNDWWAWEHDPNSPCVEPSGDACDQYHRYEDDLDLMVELGIPTYRFSIEWARIEPEPGEFSPAALGHYRRVVQAARERSINPMLTLHHFTNPRWVTDQGGWANEAVVDWYTEYVKEAVGHLGDLVDDWCTINEPNIVATFGYLNGLFPPGHMDFAEREAANANFIAAHRAARDVIKSHRPDARAGLTIALHEWTAVDGGEDLLEELRRPMEDVFLEAVRGDDFVGVQAYTRHVIGPDGYRPVEPNARLTIMGYEYRPQALEATIRRVWDVTNQVPIIVTENGIATTDDTERVEFVSAALDGLERCLADGIGVQGYIHWSLLDNFEWAFGYGPTFGLVAVDRSTQVRTPKPSASWFGQIARDNSR